MENQSREAAVYTVDDKTRRLHTALTAVMSLRDYLRAQAISELLGGCRALQRAMNGDSTFPGTYDDPEEEALYKLVELGALLNDADTIRDHLFGRDRD